MPKVAIQVQYKSYTWTDEFKNFTLENTVSQVIVQVKKLATELQSKNVKIAYNGIKVTESNSKLKVFVKTRRRRVSLVVNVDNPGGTQNNTFPEDALEECQRKVCSVYGTTELCYKMGCGHWFSWKALRGELKRQYEKDDRSFKLSCFKCSEEWDIDTALWLCDFDETTENKYEKEFCRRKLGRDCTICPSCGNMGERKIGVKLRRLACGVCGLNYCMECEKKWTGSGMILCGNHDCVCYDVQDQLDNCPLLTTKTTSKDSNVYRWIEFCGENIPSIRACPKCICIIFFQDKCQHMTCPSCRHEFCFICLGDWKDSKGNQIHKYATEKDQCKTAPRQKLR